MAIFANRRRYYPDLVRRTNEKPGLRPVQGFAQMRERGSEAEWFPVDTKQIGFFSSCSLSKSSMFSVDKGVRPDISPKLDPIEHN